MPTVEESRIELNPEEWEQVTPQNLQRPIPSVNDQPGYSSFLRCPMPFITAPDNLRQFYRGGSPFQRVLTTQ